MNDRQSRRDFIKGSIGLPLASAVALTAAPSWSAPKQTLSPTLQENSMMDPKNEAYWSQIASLYRVSPDFINLENGIYGIMSRPVMEEYKRNIDFLNENSSHFIRENYNGPGLDAIREHVAMAAGVEPEEIAITRGATEALQSLIVNYKPLRSGDTIIYADLDYHSMQYAMNYLQQRRGANLARISIPEPATRQNILDAYARAIEAHPRTKLILLTHISHRTGLVIPVAEIAAMARARNIDVIVDAAHSWGQLDFKIPELKADFVGLNLHKWIGAPLGVGFMYIRKERLQDIDLYIADEDHGANDIRSRIHTGTTNTANVMTVPAALAFHNSIGGKNKENRLRYLRDYWVSRVRGFNGIQILTPDDPAFHCAITSIRLTGQVSAAANDALVKQLIDQYGIYTVRRGGVTAGECVRITPSLFTKLSDLDRLVQALKEITKS